MMTTLTQNTLNYNKKIKLSDDVVLYRLIQDNSSFGNLMKRLDLQKRLMNV